MAYPDYSTVKDIVEWAQRHIDAHPMPDFHISPNDDHQLQRWWIVPRNRFANVYLHRFLRSDDDRALHDHPFDNASWILDGEYLEHTPDGAVTRFVGDVVQRKAEQPHRIELVTGPVLTLFTTGPIIREWGFHCPQGWRHWREFVNIEDGGNSIGKGCE